MDFALLCRTFNISNSQLLKIQKDFETFAAFLESSLTDIQHYMDVAAYQSVSHWRRTGTAPEAYFKNKELIDSHQAKVLSMGDGNYPELLAEIADAPAVLFVKGSMEKLMLPQIAVVGSRKSTAQGQQLAHQFSKYLGHSGFAITSGLALGIDAASHRGAMDAGAITHAVMGTGIDQIYPARHRALADQILASGGALVTEFMPASPPRPGHFPRRNRIVTGLSLGVLVVEAGERSGSLISARLAAEQGRAVCAVPGSLRSPVSRGCNKLIREGATLVTSPEQVVEQLGPLLGYQKERCTNQTQAIEQASDPEKIQQHWLLQLMGFDPVNVDQLCELSGRTAMEIMAALTELELAGRVSQTAYGYQRLG